MTPQPTNADVERMRIELLMQVVRSQESIVRSHELLLQTLASSQSGSQSPDKIAEVLNIIGGNVVLSQARNSVVSINTQQFSNLSGDLSQALQAFTGEVNKQMQIYKVPPEEVSQLRQSIVELGKEAEGVESGKVKGVKKAGIKAKLMAVGERLCKNLPKTVETIALFTPLAPFAHLIGETIGDLMKEVQEEC
jgi:hypothetical protein